MTIGKRTQHAQWVLSPSEQPWFDCSAGLPYIRQCSRLYAVARGTRGTVELAVPIRRMMVLQAVYWGCHQPCIVSLSSIFDEPPAICATAGTRELPYIYENYWCCQWLTEAAIMGGFLPCTVIHRCIRCPYYRGEIIQIITVNYGIINYPGDACKVLIILQYPSFISASQHPIFLPNCDKHLPLIWLVLEVQPVLMAPESSLKTARSTSRKHCNMAL